MTEQRESSKGGVSTLRLIACGSFIEGYPRYDTLWQALSRLGLQQLIDLREKITVGSEELDRLRAEQNKGALRRIPGEIRSAFRLLRNAVSVTRTARRGKTDIIFVFPANFFLTICLGILKVFHGARVYFDLYTSAYSAARTHTPTRLRIVRAYILEFLSSLFADRLICLTPEYARYYRKLYKMRADKFSVIPDGVQDIWLEEPAHTKQGVHHAKRVIYWGNYLAQHGLEMILDAAEQLKDENIEFILCGRGNRETWVREEIKRRNLDKIVLKGFIPTTEGLIRIVDSADVVLGHLRDMHDTPLSASNKLKQGMARGKPVITVWTKQKEDLYQTKDNPVPPFVQIKPAAEELTRAIRDLAANPQRAKQIGEIARSTVKRLHGIEAITSALRERLKTA